MKRLAAFLLSLIILLTPTSAFAYEKGVDVSYNNGSVDFSAIKGENVNFVMIRLGYYNHLDPNFWDNVKAASDAGLKFGIYLYSYAYSDAEAKVERDFALSTINQLGAYKHNFTLPVAYDVESEQYKEREISRKQITKNISIFCKGIEKAGRVPMVYSYQWFFNNLIDLNETRREGWKIWLAKPENNPDLSRKKAVSKGIYADLWQYKHGDNNSGGIEKFDLNAAYDFASLKKIKKPAVPKLKSVKIKKITSSKRKFTVTWKKAGSPEGYQIQYSLKKNFKKASTVKTKKTSYSSKKLKKKKKYYVRIRTYKTQYGKTYYGKWSKTKTIKIK